MVKYRLLVMTTIKKSKYPKNWSRITVRRAKSERTHLRDNDSSVKSCVKLLATSIARGAPSMGCQSLGIRVPVPFRHFDSPTVATGDVVSMIGSSSSNNMPSIFTSELQRPR
jgi:hypothetical protein